MKKYLLATVVAIGFALVILFLSPIMIRIASRQVLADAINNNMDIQMSTRKCVDFKSNKLHTINLNSEWNRNCTMNGPIDDYIAISMNETTPTITAIVKRKGKYFYETFNTDDLSGRLDTISSSEQSVFYGKIKSVKQKRGIVSKF